MRITKLVTIAVMTLILSLLGTNLLPARASEIDSGALVNIKVDSLREVVIYTETLEAENAQLKQSLQTEREAADKLLSDFQVERQANKEYKQVLEDSNKELSKEVSKLQKRGTIKNYILAILTAAVVTLAVTH